MKIVNKKKFIMRILEILLNIAIIVLTILAINYTDILREHLISVLGLILIIETIHEESEK